MVQPCVAGRGSDGAVRTKAGFYDKMTVDCPITVQESSSGRSQSTGVVGDRQVGGQMSENTEAPSRPRIQEDVAAMAVVSQANLVQLQTAAHKRFNGEPPAVASPGVIQRVREAQIDWRDFKTYEESILVLRTHEAWGQYCLFCWMFHAQDPLHPPRFTHLGTEDGIKCPGHISAKRIEIEQGLWRLRLEDRHRHDPATRKDRNFRSGYESAQKAPLFVFGQEVQVCPNADLLAATCEYVGMLASIRWIGDERWTWGQTGIMELGRQPDPARP